MKNSDADVSEFDVIVLGVGGMGSATCYELVRRGFRVLGLDRFPLVHDQGSSHGETRIIRKAYFEHPDYVPLLHRTYDKWHELERAIQKTLLLPTGLVLSGPADGPTIQGARRSAQLHGLELQNFTVDEAEARFHGLKFLEEHDVAFEPGAGTLLVEACVRAHIDEAIRHGAVIRGREPVVDWSTDGELVRVRTDRKEYVAKQLVVTTGAWANDFLKDIGLSLTVVRKFVGWFPVPENEYLASNNLPNYFFELPEGTFYGFPSFDGKTIKVAEHSGGVAVADPLEVDRLVRLHDLPRLRAFLVEHLPHAGRNFVKHSVCLYTMTADQNFVIDLHPNWKNVAFAVGFSGHGFKFCPVVGEILADLIQSGNTALPIQFLSSQREGIRQTIDD